VSETARSFVAARLELAAIQLLSSTEFAQKKFPDGPAHPVVRAEASPPHSGAVVTLLSGRGSTRKDSNKGIFMVGILGRSSLVVSRFECRVSTLGGSSFSPEVATALMRSSDRRAAKVTSQEAKRHANAIAQRRTW
jgi:hypothetical protein